MGGVERLLDQPADCFSSCRQIALATTPFVNADKQIVVTANANSFAAPCGWATTFCG
jgi:hypothetical protein